MHTTKRRLAFAAASLTFALTTAAVAADRRPPPPPPPPPAATTDTTLALASTTVAGKAIAGVACGVTADGGKVLFTSNIDPLVGTVNLLHPDIFLKNFNGNGVTRAVTTTSRRLNCLGMTPNANTVVFSAEATNGKVDTLGNSGVELAILVQNQTTGQQTRVTPLLSTFANVSEFEFAGISDDGVLVAFIAQPTATCSGYDCTANGPARMLLRDLSSGALVNLESQVRFTTVQGRASGNAWLSPSGRTLAFASRAAYPQAAVAADKSVVYAFDIASGNVRLISADAAGLPLTIPGYPLSGPSFGVQTFLANSSKIAFFSDFDTSAGPGGVYVKDLATGALDRVLGRNLTSGDGYRAYLSFSDDGRKVTYLEGSSGGVTYRSLPRVVDLATGARLNAATLTNGTVGNGNSYLPPLLSRDGKSVAFDNNSTNLLGGPSPFGGAESRAYRKLLP